MRGNYFKACIQEQCPKDSVNSPNGECRKCTGNTVPNVQLKGQPDKIGVAVYNIHCTTMYCGNDMPDLAWDNGQKCADANGMLTIDDPTNTGGSSSGGSSSSGG